MNAFLEGFEIKFSDDEFCQPQLVCEACKAVLRTVKDRDTLQELANLTEDHHCPP